MTSTERRGEIVWVPPGDAIDGSRIGSFIRWLHDERGLDLSDYEQLHAWSIADLESFWEAACAWSGIRWSTHPQRVLSHEGSIDTARWFPGGTLNYAEHALLASTHRGDELAVIERSQTRPRRTLTWSGLADRVARCRAGLVRLGVGRGDRVAAYVPNIEETVVAFLATASLGAIWASCAPEFGVRAVVDRLAQLRPTVLFAGDGYRYGAKNVDRRREVDDIVAALPELRNVVPVRYLGTGADGWTPLLAEPAGPAFDPVEAEHPLYVLFSSGTTGLPKPIVHGHGGITAEHLKALALHQDLGRGDRFFWFTTTGWMMWNYLVSGLLVGSTIVLFDGNPAHPDLSTLWRLASEEDVSVLGVSPSFLMSCRKARLWPEELFDFPALRSVASTGAPLPADGFRWVRDAVGGDVQMTSSSGGTDVCTGFVGMVPILPVRAGEMSCRLLGCDVRAVRRDGTPCPTGEEGELVLASPMPSMPVMFWNDPTGEQLRAAYFEDIPGYWRHGDLVRFLDDGACVISGRSDATLNRAGVRLGTADFYAVVESFPEVTDSLVVHLDGDPDAPAGELILFVALTAGTMLVDELRDRLNAALNEQLSPRHVPDVIEAVPVIPRTLSGKKLEVPVKRILMGMPADLAASSGSLADPNALEYFEERSTRRRDR